MTRRRVLTAVRPVVKTYRKANLRELPHREDHPASRLCHMQTLLFSLTASRASIPRPCSGLRAGYACYAGRTGQGTRGATRGVGMGYAEYAEYPRPTPPGYSDYTEWGTCCTRAMNGHLHGSCATCTVPRTQFGYATDPAAGLRPGTRATHDTYTVCVRLSLDLVFF